MEEDGLLGYRTPKPTIDKNIQRQTKALEALKANNPDLKGPGKKTASYSISPSSAPKPKADLVVDKPRKWIIPKTPEMNYTPDQLKLDKLLEQRKAAHAKEVAWTKRQTERLTQERLELEEEAKRLEEARKRWNVPTPPLEPIQASPSPTSGQEDADRYKEIQQRIASNLKNLRDQFKKEKKELEDGDVLQPSPKQHSYETTQAIAYYMIRDIIMDVVNAAVDLCAQKARIEKGRDLTAILALAAERELDSLHDIQCKERAIKLISEEIYLETTSHMAMEVIQEWMSVEDLIRSSTQGLVINSAENVATDNVEGREEEDPAYDLITATYFHMCNERRRKRAAMWKHTQTVHFLDPQGQNVTSGVVSDQDVTRLTMSKLVPVHLWPNTRISPSFAFYTKRERQYWEPERMAIQPSVIKLAKKSIGVMITAVSPTQRMLAMGTVRGDILIYDLWYDSPNPVRYMRNEDSANDSVKGIAWSLDATRILTLNESRTIYMWSMHPGGSSIQDTRNLDFESGEDEIAPSQLTLLLALESDAEDFDLQEGPLARSRVQTEAHIPTSMAFHPSHTLLGSQNSIVIGFESGDILKCNVEQQISGTREQSENTENVMLPTVQGGGDLIGQEIPVELFRAHKHPVIHLSFVGNYGNMISVDTKGHIFFWKYSRSKLSHYGWFEPVRKYWLEMAVDVYETVSNEAPEIYFSDDYVLEKKKMKWTNRDRLRAELEADRRDAEIGWRSLKMTQLWSRVENKKQDTETWVYRPDVVEPKGSPFHVIIRKQSCGILLKHYSQLYRPVLNFASQLVECRPSATGRELAFLLLFPAYTPKNSHLSTVIVKVDGPVVVQDRRIDVVLKKTEYDLCLTNNVCSFQMSNPLDASGSSYIFLTLKNALMVFSVNTGSLVLSTRKEDTSAAIFWTPKSPTRLWARSTISLATTRGSSFIILSSEFQTLTNVLKLTDRCRKEQRVAVHKAFTFWNDAHPRPVVEQTVRRTTWKLDRDVSGHVGLFVERLIQELVDRAIKKKDGEFPEEELERHAEEDRTLALRYFEQKEKGSGAKERSPAEDGNEGGSEAGNEEEEEGDDDQDLEGLQEDVQLPDAGTEELPTV